MRKRDSQRNMLRAWEESRGSPYQEGEELRLSDQLTYRGASQRERKQRLALKRKKKLKNKAYSETRKRWKNTEQTMKNMT